jgi:hypothetical protein
MANGPLYQGSVSWVTDLGAYLAQYVAGNREGKMTQISFVIFMRFISLDHWKCAAKNRILLPNIARNTFVLLQGVRSAGHSAAK